MFEGKRRSIEEIIAGVHSLFEEFLRTVLGLPALIWCLWPVTVVSTCGGAVEGEYGCSFLGGD